MAVSVKLRAMMKWWYLLVGWAYSLCLISCAVGEKKGDLSVGVFSVEELKVVRSLMNYTFPHEIDGGRYIVMTDMTRVGVPISSLRGRGNVVFHKVDDFTVSEFIRVNQKPSQLPKELALEVPVKWVEDAEVKRLFSTGGRWKQFDESFPKASGLARISRVGFSRDKKTALLYYEWLGAGMLGYGRIYILRLEDSHWRVTIEAIGDEWNA
jgi:hypothetical protein